MKPVDKFGRPIFPATYSVLLAFGERLASLDWRESRNKPNLFYKKFTETMVFADMRGTEVVPIWDEPYPLIYVSREPEDWKRRKAIRLAENELSSEGIEYRFSFPDLYLPEGLFFGDEDRLEDGFCKMCGEAIDHGGLFCSERCEKSFEQLQELRSETRKQDLRCQVCGKALEPWSRDVILHHIDYAKGKEILVCRQCHARIHILHRRFPDLAPSRPVSQDNPYTKQVTRKAKKSRKMVESQIPACTIEDGLIVCSKCKSKFVSVMDFESHWKTHLDVQQDLK